MTKADYKLKFELTKLPLSHPHVNGMGCPLYKHFFKSTIFFFLVWSYIKILTHKNTPLLALTGELWNIFWEIIFQKTDCMFSAVWTVLCVVGGAIYSLWTWLCLGRSTICVYSRRWHCQHHWPPSHMGATDRPQLGIHHRGICTHLDRGLGPVSI